MNLWIPDVPILIVAGMVLAYVHAKFMVDKHPDFLFHAGTIVIGLFWINALLSAVGLIQPWGAECMLRPVSGYIALFYVLSYPLWFIWGCLRSLLAFGRTPRQGGLLWPFTLRETTKPFRPPWNG